MPDTGPEEQPVQPRPDPEAADLNTLIGMGQADEPPVPGERPPPA